MIAIVGTRRPTPEAVLYAENLAKEAVSRGFAVASGGAEGVDAAAHRGALAQGGKTLVVAPSGWFHPYPPSHHPLFAQAIENGGGYLSLVEPNSKPLQGNFFARNAMLVAISSATVLVQAPVRSGARNAASMARRLKRRLYVVPSAPWIEQGAGCLVELQMQGSTPLWCRRTMFTELAECGVIGHPNPTQLELRLNPSDQKELGDETASAGMAPIAAGGLLSNDTELNTALRVIHQGHNTLDRLCSATGWSTQKSQSTLLRLTLTGAIRLSSIGQIEIVRL